MKIVLARRRLYFHRFWTSKGKRNLLFYLGPVFFGLYW